MATPTNVKDALDQLAERVRDIEQTSLFFPVVNHNNAAQVIAGSFPVVEMDETQKVNLSLQCPDNMVSLISLHVVMIPDATETLTADISTDMASVGQVRGTHSGATVDDTKAVTLNVMTEWDISDLAGGIDFPATAVAGDYIGIKFASDTANIRVLGVKLVCDLGR